MATIRITCPTCGKALEVGAEHEGQEVECGECLQVFVARVPGREKPTQGGKIPAAKSGSPATPKRRQDDEDDYEHDKTEEYDEGDHDPRNRRRRESDGGTSGTGLVGLIFGVLALLTACCPVTGIVLGILAMVLGAMAKRSPNGSSMGTAAAVLGSIAFLISAAMLLWLFAAGGVARVGK